LGASLLSKFHKIRIERAKRRLRRLPVENAVVELDFDSLDVNPKVKECTLYLNPLDEGLSAQIYAWRFREPVNTHFLCNFIDKQSRDIDAVVDVGGNIGYFPFVEVASGAPMVLAIEPVPETYGFLKKNMERFENAKIMNVAVSDKKEKVKMYIPSQRNLATVLGDTDYLKVAEADIKETVEVQALTLGDVVKTAGLESKRVLVRMDIEGFEENITKRLPKEVYALSFELHSYILGYEGAMKLIENLNSSGYKILLLSRELGALSPFIKLMGVRRALRLYENAIERRVFYEPSRGTISKIIKKRKENPHIIAVKK